MMALVKLAPLMSKTIADLTLEDLMSIKTALKIETLPLTPELKEAATRLLAGENIDTVANLIQSPESVKRLMDLLTGKNAQMIEAEQQQGFVHQCRHCREFEIIHF